MTSGLLLFPLHGAFFVIWLVSMVVRVYALIDAATHPEGAFVSTGKQSKTFWIVILVLSLFFSLFGLIAALIYLLDVRPAVRGSRGGRGGPGGSSSDGPYGPYRG